jgi:hypothetical protein
LHQEHACRGQYKYGETVHTSPLLNYAVPICGVHHRGILHHHLGILHHHLGSQSLDYYSFGCDCRPDPYLRKLPDRQNLRLPDSGFR